MDSRQQRCLSLLRGRTFFAVKIQKGENVFLSGEIIMEDTMYMVDSVFPPAVDKMSTRDSWEPGT